MATAIPYDDEGGLNELKVFDHQHGAIWEDLGMLPSKANELNEI